MFVCFTWTVKSTCVCRLEKEKSKFCLSEVSKNKEINSYHLHTSRPEQTPLLFPSPLLLFSIAWSTHKFPAHSDEEIFMAEYENF